MHNWEFSIFTPGYNILQILTYSSALMWTEKHVKKW